MDAYKTSNHIKAGNVLLYEFVFNIGFYFSIICWNLSKTLTYKMCFCLILFRSRSIAESWKSLNIWFLKKVFVFLGISPDTEQIFEPLQSDTSCRPKYISDCQFESNVTSVLVSFLFVAVLFKPRISFSRKHKKFHISFKSLWFARCRPERITGNTVKQPP